MTGLWLRDVGIWADVNPTTAPPKPPPPTDPVLPAPGPHALWNPTTSPTRVPINWDTAIVDTTHKMTTAMIDANTHVPYVAISDGDCQTYWTDNSTAGRLVVSSNNYGAGNHTIVCPTGAQPSVTSDDHSFQVIQPNGDWIDIYPGTRSTSITWSGNNATVLVTGYINNGNYKTSTGWPVGTPSSYVKSGFAACGSTAPAGAITPEDKSLGYIAHALALVINNNGLANGPVAPATRTDSPQGSAYPSGNTYYHQGNLLAIVPVSKGGPTRPGGWSAWQNAIVDAFTNYGGYIMDRTGGFTIRAQNIREPGISTSLTSSDFSSVMSMAAGSVGKFLFDNLRIITKGKPTLGSAHI